MSENTPHIGTLNEGSLHAALKQAYSQPGDRFEVPLGRFVIDIMRPTIPAQLIEIQTASFGSMGKKLDHLLPDHEILLVYPIAVETYLQRPDVAPRKSPKKATVYQLFEELVSIPTLLDHPNLTLDVVLASVTKMQVADPKARRGRGGFRTVDRVLREHRETQRFELATDLLRLLPDDLPGVFTTADIARKGIGRDDAQRMAYCFKALGFFTEQGRTRAGYHYSLTTETGGSSRER